MPDPANRPTKEQVREFMAQRVDAHAPPPLLEEIRRQLGWGLVEAARRERERIERWPY